MVAKERGKGMNIEIVNSDSIEWSDGHYYLIQGHCLPNFVVFREYPKFTTQDAIDSWIDYIDEKYPGLVMTDKEIDSEEYLDEYIQGGNASIYLNVCWHEIVITEKTIDLTNCVKNAIIHQLGYDNLYK